jgi:hypothetical protein
MQLIVCLGRLNGHKQASEAQQYPKATHDVSPEKE